MGKLLRVPIKKEIWLWAIEESQKDKDELVHRYPKLKQWIEGEENPTFKQVRGFADYLKVPFGYMFLESPPAENVLEVEFRAINNKLPVISKNLKDTIMEMDFRRNWMSEYRRSLGWEKLDVIVAFQTAKSGNIVTDAELAKNLFGLPDNWYKTVRDLNAAYNLLKDRLEAVGILVMQNGVVGANNYRTLDISEFRAFLLYDDVSPLIFINNNDTEAGKTFSLVHECMHVLLEQEDLILNSDENILENERYINSLTAEFLMPEGQIADYWVKTKDPLEQIHELSRMLKVSRIALAIKLKNMALIENHTLEIIKRASFDEFEKRQKSGTGGDFYLTFNSRMSPGFKEAVIRSAEAGEIEYTHAYKLLGVKGKTYNALKEEVMPYG